MFEKSKILISKFRLDSLAKTNYIGQGGRISKGRIACAINTIYSDSKASDYKKKKGIQKQNKRK